MGSRRSRRARTSVRVSPTAGANDRAQRAALMRPSRHRSALSVLGSLDPGRHWTASPLAFDHTSLFQLVIVRRESPVAEIE
jgi:hypothetical protein